MAYYLKISEIVFGPFNSQRLLQMYQSGKITQETPASIDRATWMPVSQLVNLDPHVEPFTTCYAAIEPTETGGNTHDRMDSVTFYNRMFLGVALAVVLCCIALVVALVMMFR